MRTTKKDVAMLKLLILNSALEVFTQKGYSATTIKDIAEYAGISRTPIYYHFDNKQNLFLSVYKYWSEELYKDYSKIFTSNTSIWDILRQGLKSTVSRITAQASFLQRDIILLKEEIPTILVESRLFTQRIKDLTAGAILRAINNHEIKTDTSPEHLVNLYFITYYGIEGAIDASLGIWSSEDYDTIIDEFIEMVESKYSV